VTESDSESLAVVDRVLVLGYDLVGVAEWALVPVPDRVLE
jgi:hypothetical protein